MSGDPRIRAVFRGTDWARNVVHPPRITVSPQIEKLLATPTWSVKSLLPKPNLAAKPEITPEKLHHLLRLSALPLPATKEEESRMLKTLESQIHFVKEIQQVDTSGVEPLQAIRDETDEAVQEQTITLQDLEPYLAREEKIGPNGTIRRRKDEDALEDGQSRRLRSELNWNPFKLGAGSEGRKKGDYFFVKRQKPVEGQTNTDAANDG